MASEARETLTDVDEPLIVLPILVSSKGETAKEESPKATNLRLQALPRLFYSLEELQDTPFPPPEQPDECRTTLACLCAVLVMLTTVGVVACIVMLIFNEVLPHPCPSHHVECLELEFSSNPYFRTVVLLSFLCLVVVLPVSIAACQSNCICLVTFMQEDGCWFHCKRRTLAWLRCCALAAAELKRLRCRRSKARVEPAESRTIGKRGFGAEDFGNLMIIPAPAPIPKKPAMPGFPRRWCHTALPNFHEAVELSMDGEGGEVARLILSDPTWHCPPRCEQVFRLESSSRWAAYGLMRARQRERGGPSSSSAVGGDFLGEDLDARANEQILFYGTTVEVAKEVQLHAEVPDTPHCPRHVLLRRFGGAQFCERGFMAHEQATEAGYNKESLDAPWAVLVCRVVLGRPLVHRGQHAGPRLHREWDSDQYGSILIQRDGHREYLLPPDMQNAIYPEYVVILR